MSESRRDLTEEERAELLAAWTEARRAIAKTDPMDMAGQGFEFGWLAHAERVAPVSSEPEGVGRGCRECLFTGIAPDGENECEHCYVEPPARPVVEASGDCTCKKPAEGMLGWDRSMVDPDCPKHGCLRTCAVLEGQEERANEAEAQLLAAPTRVPDEAPTGVVEAVALALQLDSKLSYESTAKAVIGAYELAASRVPSAPGICGVVCACGPNGEPLACGYEPHDGPHSWATLPTFGGENV